jgi:NADPH:quinone reductase-like Zn-dependent oxidoreductase
MVDALGAGTYAQGVTCSAQRVVARPAGLTTQQAAALLQPANSAWIAVMETAQVQSGMRVLVHGGAGAVGSQMVQLCKHLGAEVTATCRETNRDYVQGLGASRAIAYDGAEDFGTLRDQDVVFDLIGGATHARSYPVLRPGGHLVYLTAAPITDLSAQCGVRTSRALITDAQRVLQAVADLASQGVLRPRVAARFSLADAAGAHAALEAGQITRGRAVLDIAEA